MEAACVFGELEDVELVMLCFLGVSEFSVHCHVCMNLESTSSSYPKEK